MVLPLQNCLTSLCRALGGGQLGVKDHQLGGISW